ncbi:MAG: FAD-binding protein, partial [Pseudomonadota bacterium]|nr:FAD-binding protein [Pseudomonadota bacterium]
HLRAVHYWRQHQIEHYVDLSYQPLFAQIDALNQHHGDIEHHAGFQTLIQSFPQAHQAEVKKKILAHQQISYETFEALKALYPLKARTVFKVKPLTYFSMGGLAHIQFKTNLKHVYVSGEMMHDFGANREGGLPWGLYLVSGRLIYEDILAQQALNSPHYRDFELIVAPAQFEHVLLADIQQRLHESQEQQFTVERAQQCIHWFRHTRQRLVEQHKTLDDGFAWLIVAEAIMLSTLCRQESRGYFFRPDKPKEDRKLDNLLSCVHYDRQHHQIIAQLLPWPLIHQALQK